MTAAELKESLSPEDIIALVTDGLKSDGYKTDNQGNLIFQTIDHNPEYTGSYKLYYYIDTKFFHSYTIGESFDLFELIQRAGKANNFFGAYLYVLDFFGMSEREFSEAPTVEMTDDWDILNKYALIEQEEQDKTLKEVRELPESLVEFYPDCLPEAWKREGISVEAMRKFGIRMSFVDEQIIIPHRNIDGHLIGIRARSYNWEDLEAGKKYSPVYIEDLLCNHPLGENLYGLDQNQETIRQTRKAVIVEGEKSVLLAETYYPGDNFVVAACGSNISDTQVNMLLKLGVQEIIIAFDKENDKDIASEQSLTYQAKLVGLAQKFTPYVNVYLVYDFKGLLDYKDSPFDKGQETLEKLLKEKEFVPCVTYAQSKRKQRRKKK